jgi:hypothetical protein
VGFHDLDMLEFGNLLDIEVILQQPPMQLKQLSIFHERQGARPSQPAKSESISWGDNG